MGLAEEEERLKLLCLNACRTFFGRCQLTLGVTRRGSSQVHLIVSTLKALGSATAHDMFAAAELRFQER